MHDPFFVVGCGRSGTTLLRLMLTAHPNLSVAPEGNFLLALDGRIGDPTDLVERARFVNGFFGIEKCREWGFDRDVLCEAIAALAPRTWPELAAVPHWAYLAVHHPQANRWGDKNPHYISHIRRLLQLYPRARVIHIVRDGRDVALSWLAVDFGPRTLEEAARRWGKVVALGNRLAQALPDQILEVRYERLVADPEGELRAICAFLGEPWAPSMVTYDQLNRTMGLMPSHRLAWHGNTLNPPDPSRIGRWESSMTASDLVGFERIAGPVLEANGYRCAG